MRLILVTTAALAATTLAGCGQSEAAFREEYRASAITACTNGAQSAGGALAGMDFERMCTCSIDRYMESKSVAELRTEQQASAVPPEAQAALQQCVAEQMGAAMQGNEAAPAE